MKSTLQKQWLGTNGTTVWKESVFGLNYFRQKQGQIPSCVHWKRSLCLGWLVGVEVKSDALVRHTSVWHRKWAQERGVWQIHAPGTEYFMLLVVSMGLRCFYRMSQQRYWWWTLHPQCSAHINSSQWVWADVMTPLFGSWIQSTNKPCTIMLHTACCNMALGRNSNSKIHRTNGQSIIFLNAI